MMQKITTKNLLVELFVEELPPKVLKKLGEAFGSAIEVSLVEQDLIDQAARGFYPLDVTKPSPVQYFASPRRLGVLLAGVLSAAPDKQRLQKLMPVSVGLNADGEATPALLKKLASAGADASAVPTLKRQMDGKAEALFLDSVVTGATLAAGLQKALDDALANLPIPKMMQYQLADGWTSVHFVRPAHGLVALHGEAVVPVTALGLAAGRTTHGHRFEAALDPIELPHADRYAELLESQGAVIAGFDARRAEIARQLHAAAATQGLTPIDDAALLDEVTALVERPNVLVCRFEEAFLAVPPECLILTMKANQKYFPLLDAQGRLTNRFLVVSNIRPADPGRVIEGNERVVRPRLADAKFFFDQDRRQTLESRVGGLVHVVYHNRLGSQAARLERVRAIARSIGLLVGGRALEAQADMAAKLSKADLLTDMVGEFPELQGIMGRYYAQHDGIDDEIAFAIQDHYRPRFAGDELPRSTVGLVVALADKLETLVGMFAIGQEPTGDKDPFALRRHALGVVRMLVERALPLGLSEILDVCRAPFHQEALSAEATLAMKERQTERGAKTWGHLSVGLLISDEVVERVGEFIYERLAGYLRERGYASREIDAVASLHPPILSDVVTRLEAVRAFLRLPEAPSLAAANKRVSNILKKATDRFEPSIGDAVLKEKAEVALARELRRIEPIAETAYGREEYAEALLALAALKEPIDAFFETVMVNVEDESLRVCRLCLLAKLHAAMNRVADLSKLAA